MSKTETDIPRWIACAIAQVSTSSMSFLASTSIAIMIARKTPSGGGGLSTPYRRLIFGISIGDMFQSFALATGPWSPPPDDGHHALWGRGNVFTCTVNGVFMTLGMSPVPMYVCCLCIYYLCKLKLQMTDEAFTGQYEWKMHVFIIAFNTVFVVTALAMNTIHTTVPGTFCHFAALPTGCRQEPDLFGECDVDLAFHVQNFLLVNSILVPFCSLVGIVTTMVMLFRNVLQRERIYQASHHSRPRSGRTLRNRKKNKADPQTRSSVNDNGDSAEDPSIIVRQSAPRPVQTLEIERQDHEQQQVNEKKMEAERLARLYRKETMLQAFLYVGAFCASFFPTWILIVLLLMGISNHSLLLSNVELLVSICYPIQGLLNIFVYTRPFVTSLRRTHPEYSWLYAFSLVFAAGGEVPKTTTEESEPLNNMMGDHHLPPDPSFSLSSDFASIVTPSFVVSASNLSLVLSVKDDSNSNEDSRSNTKSDNDSKTSSPAVRTGRRFYKWPFSSGEGDNSIWRGVGKRSTSSKGPLGSSFANPSFDADVATINNDNSSLGTGGDFLHSDMIDSSNRDSGTSHNTSSHNTARTRRRFYKWPFSSNEEGDSIWRGISVRSTSSNGGLLYQSTPGSAKSGSRLGSSSFTHQSFHDNDLVTTTNKDDSGAGDFCHFDSSSITCTDRKSIGSGNLNNVSSIVDFRSTRLSSVKEISLECLEDHPVV